MENKKAGKVIKYSFPAHAVGDCVTFAGRSSTLPVILRTTKVVNILDSVIHTAQFNTLFNIFSHKKQKVSHEVGHFKPKDNLYFERLLPKHYMRMGDINSTTHPAPKLQ